ncbi:MAG: hypothetical protein U0Y68_03310 [Blastocatellia bacterium]
MSLLTLPSVAFMKMPKHIPTPLVTATPLHKELPVLAVSPLPPLYDAWMREALTAALPTETAAPCDNCAMLPTAGEAAHHTTTFFNPSTKCCTYLPGLPNFLVGRALADQRTATGRASVVARLQEKIAVTPFGLGMSRKFVTLYSQGTNVFGQSQSLRCPHYLAEENGNCGVWRHRNATCATWFCKHERGARGDQFWQALLQLLASVEQHLAQWCVLELQVGEVALQRLFQPLGKGGQPAPLDGDELDGRVNPARYQSLWGDWHGREEEFYRQCAGLVEGLRWSEVLAHCGPDTRAFLQLANAALTAATTEALPAHLQVGTFQLLATTTGNLQAVTYSPYDPLSLSPRLLACSRISIVA